jgi:hypothetical protein
VSSYFVSENPALHRLIERHLEDIKTDVLNRIPRDEIVALILGGGYGRGEGGVLTTDDGPRPYNDYDLVLVHQGKRERKLRRSLHEIHLAQTSACGIHVDITPLRLAQLPQLPPSLTWFELAAGHKVLWGPSRILLEMGPRRLGDVPPSEWGRLLFNRGSGLLLSLWFDQNQDLPLFHGETFESFVTRQIGKAWLALGDTHLAALGLYDSSVLVRRDAWLRLNDRPAWSASYLDAISFKLEPTLTRARDVLATELALLCDLYGSTLSHHISAESRPLVSLQATMRHVKPGHWFSAPPWLYPRERMRFSLLAELQGDNSVRERLIGSPSDYVLLLERYG